MQSRVAILPFVVLMLISTIARGVDSGAGTSQPSLSDAAQTMVLRLGDPDPAVREQAQQRLQDLGAAARPALLRATKSDSPEISGRAREILQSLPWDIEDDPATVRSLLTNYGQRETTPRMQVVRQLFELRNGAGYPALARLIVEDSDAAVEWRIASAFRDSSMRLSPAQAKDLTLAADNPAALCLAGWCCQPTDFRRAIALYELAVHDAMDRNEPCLDGLAPVFQTLVNFKRYQRDYDGAAELLRSQWLQTLKETGDGDPDTRPLDELFALHATRGPLNGFARDIVQNPDVLIRAQTLYALGRLCDNHQHAHVASLVYALAYCRGIGSPATREATGEFLLEQNWPDLAERELLALTRSWFAYGATIDSANMRLGLLHANLGHDQQAANYLALALPGLHARSVWLSLQHGDHHFYGRGAEKYLWTLQHFHAMRFALSQKDDKTAEKEAIEIAKLGTEDEDFVLGAVPVLKASNHPAEASSLFEAGFKSLKATLEESPNDPHRLNNVAWLCAACRERIDEALSFAEQASALAPNDANILDTLAEVQFAKGNVQEAIATEQRGVRLQPQNAYLKRRLSEFEQAR